MKTLKTVLLIAAIIVVVTSCISNSPIGREACKTAEETSAVMTNEIVPAMTDDELDLMANAFGNDERDRFEEGRLLRYHREALMELRAGLSYLENRYPNHEFIYESFIPASKFQPWAEIYFAEEPPEECLLTVRPEDNFARFVCKDNFYGQMLREDYDAIVEKVLSDAGYKAASYTSFIGTAGEEFPADPAVEEFMSIVPPLSRQTALYVPEAVPDESLKEAFKAVLSEKGIYGDYFLYFTGEEVTDAAIYEQRNMNKETEFLTFHCWPQKD